MPGLPDSLKFEAYTQVGLSELAASRVPAARESLTRAFEISRATFGAGSVEAARAGANLALAVWAGGDTQRALELQRESLTWLRLQLGESDPRTLRTEANLASVLGARGEWARATQILHKAAAQGRESGGYLWIVLEAGLGAARREGGEIGESRRDLSLAYIRALGIDPHSPETIWVQGHLAQSLALSKDRNDWRLAMGLAGSVVERNLTWLGETHPQTLFSMRMNARAALPHDPDLALMRGIEAAGLSDRVLGRQHFDTIEAWNEVATGLVRQGQHGRAREIHAENAHLLAADAGAQGATHPPIGNLGVLLTSLAVGDQVLEHAVSETPSRAAQFESTTLLPVAPPARTDIADPDGLVRRTAHAEIDNSEEIKPGETFTLAVWVDTEALGGAASGELTVTPSPDVDELELRVWVVPTRHFRIAREATQILALDLRGQSTRRLAFVVETSLEIDIFEDEPRLRVLFSHQSWPCGEVSLPVRLAQAAGVTL